MRFHANLKFFGTETRRLGVNRERIGRLGEVEVNWM
jgi:hypothetical protein